MVVVFIAIFFTYLSVGTRAQPVLWARCLGKLADSTSRNTVTV